MIFRRTLTGFVLLIFSLYSYSQSDSLIARERISSDIRMSFNSSLIYPGIRAGIEFPVYNVDVLKNLNSNEVVTIKKERLLSANFGWYHHPDFHDNLYFTAEWTMRRTNGKGFFTEFSPGLGYSRTFLGGTTYKVNDHGDVTIVKYAGYNYVMMIAGAGLGFDFSKYKGIPVSVFYKFDMLTMFPYNSTVYFRPAMELGMIYKPEGFIKVLVKKRIIKK